MAKLKDISQLFFSGQYSEVLEWSASHKGCEKYLLGSYIFLGRDIEAKSLLSEVHWSNEDHVEVLFYFLLSTIRQGNYELMKEAFFDLHRACQLNRSRYAHFYINQSLALIRFYLGEFEKACRYSQASFELGLSLKNDYLCMLSTDLLGHSLCMMEDFAHGQRVFDLAVDYAGRIENNSNLDVIKLSKMIYEIESGVNLKSAKKSLVKWISSIRIQDYYSMNNAKLLMVKVLIYEGDLKAAEQILEEIGQTIFSYNHRRQILNYNLSFSYLSYLLQGSAASLNIVKNSYQYCIEGQDYHFYQRFKELETFISRQLSVEMDQSGYSLTFLENKTGRKAYCYQYDGLKKEDGVHQTIARLQGKEIAFPKIKELAQGQFLGALLMGGFYPLKPFIDFSLGRRSILIYLRSKIYLIEELTLGQMEMLRALVQKRRWSRQEFFEAIWKIPYDSFVHDNKIYVSLKRLKSKLPADLEIFHYNKGDLIVASLEVLGTTGVAQNVEPISIKIEAGLNVRQLRLLQKVKAGDVILPRNYALEHQVSRNTASRDLQKLTELGKVSKHGEKRGTFYVVC